MEDTRELREELTQAWIAVLDGAVDRGCPRQTLLETMASVAHERFAESFGAEAAASYLQLLAEQLRAGKRHETLDLIQGQRPAPVASDPERESETGGPINLADLLL